MNIKSLLLGSATALVAVSGAKAVDAIIIPEPEPVEYVRVCDAYGVGFFYIPGTETCLRIGGEVRYQLGTSNDEDAFDVIDSYRSGLLVGTDTPGYHGFVADTWNKEARGRFFLDARSDTEWGTLRGFIRVDASRGGFAVANSANNIRTNKAFIQLGGFKVGWEDSALFYSPNGGLSGYGSHTDGGLNYGYQQRNVMQYNWLGSNGAFATISLEDDNMNTVAPLAASAALGYIAVPGYSDNNLMPDVVGRVGISQGWGAVWATVAYDEDRTNGATMAGFANGFFGGDQIGEDGWAAIAGVHLNIPNMTGSSLRVLGFYADSDNAYNGHGGNWSVIASYGQVFTPTLSGSVGFQYTADLYVPGTDIEGDADRWDAELGLVWSPVTDFTIRGEVVYSKIEDLDGTTSGFLRFSRFF